MNNKKYVIVFDFDNVISTYKRPFKFDKLGKPCKEIIETIKYYYKKGYYILIFTGRMSTPKFVKWLKKYNIPYDGINIDPRPHIHASRFKVYFDVIIDDKAINFHNRYNVKSKKQLIKEIDKIIKLAKK